jgi:hypothetical protein
MGNRPGAEIGEIAALGRGATRGVSGLGLITLAQTGAGQPTGRLRQLRRLLAWIDAL